MDSENAVLGPVMHNSQARLDQSICCAGSSCLGSKASTEEVAPEAPRAATFSSQNTVFKNLDKRQIAVEKLGEAPPTRSLLGQRTGWRVEAHVCSRIIWR